MARALPRTTVQSRGVYMVFSAEDADFRFNGHTLGEWAEPTYNMGVGVVTQFNEGDTVEGAAALILTEWLTVEPTEEPSSVQRTDTE